MSEAEIKMLKHLTEFGRKQGYVTVHGLAAASGVEDDTAKAYISHLEKEGKVCEFRWDGKSGGYLILMDSDV